MTKYNLALKNLLSRMWRELHPTHLSSQVIDLKYESQSKANIKLETTGQNVTKTCKICHVEKPITEFHKNGAWTRPECKECCNAMQRDYLKLRREHKTPEIGTPCECCGRTDEKLQWDHCHETLDHRGWLCNNCNTGIGKLGDNITGVMQALAYLGNVNRLDPDEDEVNDMASG